MATTGCEIRNVLHLDPDFFQDLALYRLLDRLARFHETGNEAVEAGPEVAPTASRISGPLRTSVITAG